MHSFNVNDNDNSQGGTNRRRKKKWQTLMQNDIEEKKNTVSNKFIASISLFISHSSTK